MDNTKRLSGLNDDKLFDVVNNYKRYGYDDDIRDTAIAILEERGHTMEWMGISIQKDRIDYDEAEKQYNAFRRNSKIAIFSWLFSFGLLSIVYLIFLYKAHLNQDRFYEALGKENDNSLFVYTILSILIYFHIRDKMSAELHY